MCAARIYPKTSDDHSP